MSETDTFKTQRAAVITDITAELAKDGFAAAQEIGRGSFGEVYRCTQEALDRTGYAVKALTAHLEKGNRERFLRVHRAIAKLTGCPSIAGVLQVGITTSGLFHLVMPYHPHGSFDAGIRRHSLLSTEETLRVSVGVVGDLETAHRLGVLHRDVTPGNILNSVHGEPALTDFGITRIPDGFQTATETVTGSRRSSHRAQGTGITSDEIEELFQFADDGPTDCCAGRALARVAQSARRNTDLRRMQQSVAELITTCEIPRAERRRPILTSLNQGEDS
ncbi:protein kinase domain-containing protein [Nocardia sp. NPDC055049]